MKEASSSSSNQPATAQMELRKLRLRCAQFEQRMDELRRMLLDLGQERDQLRQLYDSVPVACMTLDASGTLLEGNARAAALLGMEPAFLSGLKLANAIAVPQHVDRLRAHLGDVMRGRRPPSLRALATQAGRTRDSRTARERGAARANAGRP